MISLRLESSRPPQRQGGYNWAVDHNAQWRVSGAFNARGKYRNPDYASWPNRALDRHFAQALGFNLFQSTTLKACSIMLEYINSCADSLRRILDQGHQCWRQLLLGWGGLPLWQYVCALWHEAVEVDLRRDVEGNKQLAAPCCTVDTRPPFSAFTLFLSYFISCYCIASGSNLPVYFKTLRLARVQVLTASNGLECWETMTGEAGNSTRAGSTTQCSEGSDSHDSWHVMTCHDMSWLYRMSLDVLSSKTVDTNQTSRSCFFEEADVELTFLISWCFDFGSDHLNGWGPGYCLQLGWLGRVH